MRSDRFEWDDNKAESNKFKHGISFEQAEEIFDDPQQISIRDPDHSQDEERFLTIGTTLFDLVLVVSHTMRGERIRIISARKANRAERRMVMSDKNGFWINDQAIEVDDMRPEYDFSGGERGKFYQGRGRTVVRVSLDPDVAKHYSRGVDVNEALRRLIAEGKAPPRRDE
ncbi:MAG TPA: BrnT family toxin [Thermoanaerobaculia bacterium]|nr:BrnT family toxin [Thermoanaerobaculia bacterium]